MWKIFYNILFFPIFILLVFFGSFFVKKIRVGFIGRLSSIKILNNFSKKIRNEDLVYWFHAASHGEFEQIKPVLNGLKEIEPKSKIILSFFSPSGYNNVIDDHVDCKIYLPFDSYWTTRKIFSLVKPKKLILAGYDVWPNLIWSASLQKIHTVIFAAKLSSNTSKLAPVIKIFYKSVYKHISAFYTINNDAALRLKSLLNESYLPIIRVLGNPRYDQVKEKSDLMTIERTKNLLKRPKRLILGSIHEEDKNVILEPIIKLMKVDTSISCIWAPDEINVDSLDKIKLILDTNNISSEKIGEKNLDEIQSRVIFIDSIGKLSRLYWEGQIAYVGGGFSFGVHNVMEPAIARLPVIFGPKYKKSDESIQLIKNGGGFIVDSSVNFYMRIKMLFNDSEELIRSSYSSTKVIHDNLGSSTRVVRGLIHD